MTDEVFIPYFKVVDTYEERGFLILVSDIDSSLAKVQEEIEINRVGMVPTRVKASLVKFWGRDPNVRSPLCLAVKGFKKAEIPLGTLVLRRNSEPVQIGRKKYERIPISMPETPAQAPMPGGVTDVTKSQDGKKV